MFAVTACDFDGNEFWACGSTLNHTWNCLLAENGVTEDEIDFETIGWFARIDGVKRKTVAHWVSPDFE